MKNNTVENVLLEQRDYVRYSLDATADLAGGTKGNRKPGETKAPLDGFRSFRRLPPSHPNSNYNGETVITLVDIKGTYSFSYVSPHSSLSALNEILSD